MQERADGVYWPSHPPSTHTGGRLAGFSLIRPPLRTHVGLTDASFTLPWSLWHLPSRD